MNYQKIILNVCAIFCYEIKSTKPKTVKIKLSNTLRFVKDYLFVSITKFYV